ncbi:uncharacterized protein LOC119458762 isoform X2 [Dermacentor silvarum]|uniref:uncharacterized protein LOC119458762 isoform X2 n=1 Tax=Dermacentor silvarum TaxID=543639 RepID=UPI0021010A2C|nr:uncharacterized protein LOC119458762 isoform X2 [Dermacentor silvarum]
MSSALTRHTTMTGSDSPSESSHGSATTVDQTDVGGDDTDSSLKALVSDIEQLPPSKVPPVSTTEKDTVSAGKGGVAGAGRGAVKPVDGTAILAPGTPHTGSPTKRSLDDSTASTNMDRAVSDAQQKRDNLWQRSRVHRSGRKGRGKPGYDDEEEMVATSPVGGGRGAAGRARPTARPKAVAAPVVRGPAPPPGLPPPSGQTGGAQPGDKEPARPRLVLSKKGLVRAAPNKSELNPGAAAEPPSAQPMVSGAKCSVAVSLGMISSDRDEESSSTSPPREDTDTPPPATPPDLPSMRRPSVAVKPAAAVTAPAVMPAATSKPPEVTAAVTSSAEPEKAAVAEEVPLAQPALSATLAAPAAPAPTAPSVPLVSPVLQAQPPPSATATKPVVAQKLDAKKSEAAPVPVPKSTWWEALAPPFSLTGEPVTSGAVGPNEEVPVPAHVRRYSMAMTDNQRAQARTNVKLKRAPHVTEDLKDYAALLGSAVGSAGVPGGQTAAGPSAAGNVSRGAPQRNEMIEDILDYEYGSRMQPSLEIEGSDFVGHRRRRKFSLAGLCGRCFVLFSLISATCGLLFFTFHLGQTLSKNLGTPGVKLFTTNATSETTTSSSVVTSPTSTSSTKRTTKATTTTSTTTALPSAAELYDDVAGRFRTCAKIRYPDPPRGVPVLNTSNVPYRASTRTQYRKLLCVIDTRYFSARRPYVVDLLPTTYCSELIFYAAYVDDAHLFKVRPKRGHIDQEFLAEITRLKQLRTHRGDRLRLHVTLGGSHSDSPNFVEMLEKYELRDEVVMELHGASNFFDGVNIHWDRPGGYCDEEFTPAYFRAFIEVLYLKNMSLILTVPPVLELVRNFWLISLTRYTDYVIVTTHTLRRKGVLDCSGRREFAAASYLAIRDHVFHETANPFQAAKVIYSIALGADVFRATVPLSSPRLLDAATPSSVFDGPTVQTNKTSYDHVCRMPKGVFDGECAYAIRQQSTGSTELALFAGPEELATRMRNSYASRMGDTPVAVYDLFLDDFGGNCVYAGGPTTRDSPLVAAIAETGL